MKTTLLSVMACIFSLHVIAQQNLQFENFKKKVKSKISAQVKPNHKTRAIKQRLILDSTFSKAPAVFTWMRSNSNKYSGERGSVQYMLSTDIYHDCYVDTNNYLEYNGATINKYKSLVKYNAQNQYIEFTELVYNDATMVYDSIYRGTATYNAQNLVTENLYLEYLAGNWVNANKMLYFYNGQNLNTQIIDLDYNGVSFDTTGKTDYSYLGNNVVKEEYQSYDLGINSWIKEYEILYTYNAQNKMLASENNSGWSGVAYDYHMKDIFFYDGNNRIDSSYKQSWISGGPVNNNGYYKYNYNGTDTFFSTTTIYDGSNTRDYKNEFTFDANKNLINFKQYQFSFADSFRSYTNYYYEDYNVATELPTLSGVQEIKLYPNPAGARAYLDFFATQPEKINITIADMTGKVLQTMSEDGFIGNHLVQIPLTNYPTGLYIVNILAGNRPVKSLKLAKTQ